jgi:hypothetical protein
MKGQPRIRHLEAIARVGLDRDLAELKAATDRREALKARLAGLEPAAAPGLDPLTAARIGAAHQIWADARRAEINIALARSTADWLDRQDKTRKSFGRWQVLGRLAAEKEGRPRG